MRFSRVLACVAIISVLSVWSCANTPSSGQQEQKPDGNTAASPPPETLPASPQEKGPSGKRFYDVLFTIGDVPVTVQELKEVMDETTPHGQRSVVADGKFRNNVLQELMARNYLFIEARKRGLDKGGFLTLREKMLVDQWLGAYYQENYLKPRITVPEDEVKRFLPKSFEYATVREIVVETKEEADQVFRELRAGKSFEALAREKSLSPSAAKGGLLQVQFTRGKAELYDQEVQERLFSVNAGELVPEPVQTPMGLAIFRIEARVPFTPKEKDGVFAWARTEVWNERFRALTDKLEEQYPPKVIGKNIEKASSDPLEHLDLPVATVGTNRVSFGETFFFFERSTRGKSDPYKLKAKDWIQVLAGQIPNLVLREAAKEEGMLNTAAVRENIDRYHKFLVVENLRESLRKGVKVTPDEVRRRHEELKTAWRKTKLYRVSMAQLAEPGQARAAADRMRRRESLEGILEPSLHGGNREMRLPVVTMREEEIPPLLLPHVLKMKKGDVAGPIVVTGRAGVPEGYAVLRLEDVEVGKIPPMTEVRKDLEGQLLAEKVRLLTSEIVIRASKTIIMKDYREDIFEKVVAEWDAERRRAPGKAR